MRKGELQAKVNHFPRRPGVYHFLDEYQNVLYVGKALSLRDRLSSYAEPTLPKTQKLVAEARDVRIIETGSEFEALLLEARLIKIHRPKYNIIFRDDKSYLYIFISTGEEYPKLFITRRPKLPTSGRRDVYDSLKGEYFGPFPSAMTTRSVIKLLRRIFPFCQQKGIKRLCFYSHLRLCNPCPSQIVAASPVSAKILKKRYRKNLLSLANIFRGRLVRVKQDVERDMQKAANILDFETASKKRDQLKQLEYITQPQSSTKEFLTNPNFYFEKQQQASDDLYHILLTHYPDLSQIHHIECYDISHFAGKWAVGSQVVFIEGIPEKSLYRRYRISKGNQSDTAMLSEVVDRRLKHREWTYPDLWLVDGGKPQVSALKEVLTEHRLPVHLIGLAKREERVVVITNGILKELNLPRRSESLQLLQQIRDETHRFALSYHHKRIFLTQSG